MDSSLLGDRMKEYESRNQYFLQRRTPVIIRVDGKAFHTFTRGFQKPFDEVLGNAMVRTMEYLCQNISGCIFGYVQSDEITLVLQDYRKLNTDAWFGYRTDKLCSIAASMATMAFNTFFKNEVDKFYYNHCSREDPLFEKHYQTYRDAQYKGAMFDARCFNIPKEEVCNCIYWRQLDAPAILFRWWARQTSLMQNYKASLVMQFRICYMNSAVLIGMTSLCAGSVALRGLRPMAPTTKCRFCEAKTASM